MRKMTKSRQQYIKETILDFLGDGEPKKLKEIKEYMGEKGISFEKDSNLLYMILFELKKENSNLKNPQRGIYVLNKEKDCGAGNEAEDVFADFVTVKESSQKKAEMVITIMENGTLVVNGPLLRSLKLNEAEIRLKKDGTEILLIESGEVLIRFGKNGRIKNYDIVDKLSYLEMKFPVYYVGKWDDDKHIWRGRLADYNPNRA